MIKNAKLEYSDEELNILFITPANPSKAVYSTAVLNKVIELCPRAKITIASSFAAAPLFAAAPHVEKIVAWEKPCSLRVLPKIIFKKWDIIIDCKKVSSLPFFLAKTKLQGASDYHEIIGFEESDLTPTIWIADEIVRGAEHRLFKKEHVIGIAPFDDNGEAIIPLKDTLTLLQKLTLPGGIFPSSPIAFFGFEPIRKKAENELISKIPDWQRINLIGSLGLLSIEGCLEKCRFFIGGDSVISHMAAVANIASLIIEDTEAVEVKPKGRYISVIPKEQPLDEIIKAIDDLWHGRLKQK